LKYRADPKSRENFVLFLMHPAEPGGGSIVEAAQVQHAVQGIKEQFALDSNTAHTGLPPGLGNADDY
jgi:hypothetical protein